MNKNIRWIVALVATIFLTSLAHAATDWSTQDYDLYPGDFNGDGKTDILYIAKDPAKPSGIAISDGSAPNVSLQSWPSNYLGIQWYGGLYVAVVADYNHDGRADALLQRTSAGDSYLLLADANGRLTGISQAISNSALGLTWSRDQHIVSAGDFNGDGFADLFFQATSPTGTNAVVLADGYGTFTSGPTQSWTDASWAAFKWSTKNSVISVGDFNGDGKADLLVQRKPDIVMVDYDISIPVPVYKPNTFGVVLSQGGSTPLQQAGVQQWSRNANGVDWSPQFTVPVIGDFNGDGRADVLLQAKAAGKPSYLLTGNASGAAFSLSATISANVAITANSARLVAGNFDGSGGVGFYIQSTSPSGTNYVANSVAASTTASAHDPAAVTGVVPATAVGRTAGSFAVSNSGAASYSIPIVVPQGVAGVQPSLALTYSSGGTNGLLGVGWNIAGFSEIARCPRTLAQDGVTERVLLTTNDRFCMDGNKLRLTGGTYGTSGSTYQTEIETFSRVTASGTAGNGPAYFTVEGRDGLYYRYGYNADSRILAVGTSTARIWALDQVSDRAGNVMSISYRNDYTDSTSNGSYRPDKIRYTTNANASLNTPAYEVSFVWDLRPSDDVIYGFSAGGFATEIYRLNRIETKYNGSLVRKYQLSYNQSSTSRHSRLGAVQECEGQNGTCLSPTTVNWRDGTLGWSESEIVSNTDSNAKIDFSHPIDFDGDGRTDLVFPLNHSGNYTWAYMHANASGGFDSVVDTGYSAGSDANPVYAFAQPLDLYSTGRRGVIYNDPAGSAVYALLWTPGVGFQYFNAYLGIMLSNKTWVGDFDGDGREDVLQVVGRTFNVYKNLGGVFTGAQVFYTAANHVSVGAFSSVQGPGYAPIRLADFNADGKVDLIIPQTITECEPNGGGGQTCTSESTWLGLNSTGTSFVTNGIEFGCLGSNGSYCPPQPLVADFDGDGISDLAFADKFGAHDWLIRYARGNGVPVDTGVVATNASSAFAMDYDGDGRADIFYADSTYWSVLRSTGTGLASPVATTIAASFNVNTFKPLDIDGDGQVDVGYVNGQFRVRRHSGVIADMVSAITDGFGNGVSLTYAPLTDNSVYTKGTTAVFPEIDLQVPMYVVKKYSANDGIGGTYDVNQTYAGARVHLQGRGYEGFSTRSETDSRFAITNYLTFRQDYPYTGKVTSSESKQQNGHFISSATTSYSDLIVEPAQYNDRHFVYASGGTQTAYEISASNSSIDGVAVKNVVSAVNSVDSFGNPTSVTATTNDLTGSGLSYSTTTSRTISNDTTNWCIGLATQQQVSTSIPNAAPLAGNAPSLRTIKFDPDTDATKCRIYRQTIEPNTSLEVATTFLFDNFGHVRQTTTSAAGVPNRVASADYGSQGVYAVQFTSAVGEVSNQVYNYALSVPISSTDPNGIQTTFQYDGFGRKLRSNAPDGTATTWSLYSCTIGNAYCGDNLLRYQVVQQQLDGSTSHNVIRSDVQLMDQFGRALYVQSQALSGAYSNVRSIYNNKGQLAQRSAPYFTGGAQHYSTFTYDLVGRLLQVQREISDSNSALQSIQYSYAKLVESVTDPLNHTTTRTRNAIGQLIQVTDAASSSTQYQYDSLGNLAKTTDSAGNQVSSTFNVRGFKVASSDPDMGNWTYDYYPTGELKTQTDAKNQITSFTYDATSRLLTRTEAEGTSTFVYGSSAASHNIGKIQSVSGPGGYSEAYTYDSLGRPQTITYTEDTTYQVDYTYNNQGALDTLTYPVSTSGYRFKLQYAYTNGQLAQVRDFANGTQFWTINSANAAGQAIDETLANGVRSITGFDSISGSMSYRQSGSGGSTSNLQNLSYEWDKAGNLVKRYDNRQAGSCANSSYTNVLCEAFTYDALNRIDSSTLNGTQNLDVNVNAIGNITLKSDVSASNFDYSTQQAGCTYYTHAQPHAVRKVGSNIYCYDANGNMTSRAGSAITWTSYNLPSQIGSGSNSSQFSYAPGRQRWKQIASYGGQAETTIYVGGLVEKVTRGTLTEYKHYIAAGSATAIYTRRSDATASTYYVSSDHLGSGDLITDGSAAVIVRESFAAYGERRGSNWTGSPSTVDQNQFTSTTRRGYTGHEMLDNLSLIHMNGRVYDPKVGRFISADPFVQEPSNQQSLNRYSYVMNGPMSATDPSGYFSLGSALNPFSRDNPLSPVGNIGRFFAGAPLAGPLFTPEAGGLLTLLGSNYQANKDTDRFFIKNPDWQPVASVIVTAVFTYYGGPVTGAIINGAVDAHFARINGGGASDILKTYVVSSSTTLASYGAGAISNPLLNTLAHAAIGCASAATMGGNCGQGALASGFGAGFSNFAPSSVSDSFIGATVAGGIGSELGGGDFWEGAKLAGIGYVANSAFVRAPEQGASGQSSSGTAPPWASDPSVAAEMNKAWMESNPYAPSVPSGQSGSVKVEQGGWVVESWFSSGYEVKRVAPGTRDSLPDMTGSRPFFCFCTVKGWFHTHPNTGAEHYAYGASPGDLSFSRNYAKVPGVIKTHIGDIYIPYP